MSEQRLFSMHFACQVNILCVYVLQLCSTFGRMIFVVLTHEIKMRRNHLVPILGGESYAKH